MNSLEKLIQQYCPNGVEYRKIKDVFTRLRGTPITAKEMREIEKDDGEITIYAGGKTVVKTNENLIPNANIIRKPAVLVQSRGLIDFIYCDKPFTFKNELWAYTHDNTTMLKFLCYVLKVNTPFFRTIASKMGSLPQIALPNTENFSVPVPPLPVQEEIVRILEAYTELEAKLEIELKAELEARRKQYEYYRNELLSFDKLGGGGRHDKIPFLQKLCNKYCPNGVEYKTLGEICEVSRGKVISKDYIQKNPGIYPVYSSQTVNDGNLGDISTYDYCGEFLTWTTDGANAGSVFYRNGRFNITNVCGLLKVNIPNFHIRFLYHWLSIKTSSYVVSGMGNPKLMSNVMSQIIVPVPPLPVQEEIVRILDRFDALVNDISVGLPAELSARRQQYEYYRNRLLTFERAR